MGYYIPVLKAGAVSFSSSPRLTANFGGPISMGIVRSFGGSIIILGACTKQPIFSSWSFV